MGGACEPNLRGLNFAGLRIFGCSVKINDVLINYYIQVNNIILWV